MSDCKYCDLIEKKSNGLYENEHVFVMLSPEPAVKGHVVILPKKHAPIIELCPDFVVADMFKVAQKVQKSILETLGAQGTNVLVQNGVVSGQKSVHAMLHVLPRFENDGLELGWNPKPASADDLAKSESKIKEFAKNVGVFEKEKPKPIEVPKTPEVKAEKGKEDYRIKNLRRIP